MGRYTQRTDSNHAEIVRRARQVGCAVIDIHALAGTLDIVVGFRGVIYLVEIKDGAKIPSKRRLTPAEEKTVEEFRRVDCPVYIVESADDLLRVIGASR